MRERERQVARMMKRGETFLGLEFRGLALFLPVCLFLGLVTFLIYLVNPSPGVALIGGILDLSIPYLLFYTEERTGKMGYQILIEVISILLSKNTYNLNWEETEGYDEYRSLKIRVEKRK